MLMQIQQLTFKSTHQEGAPTTAPLLLDLFTHRFERCTILFFVLAQNAGALCGNIKKGEGIKCSYYTTIDDWKWVI